NPHVWDIWSASWASLTMDCSAIPDVRPRTGCSKAETKLTGWSVRRHARSRCGTVRWAKLCWCPVDAFDVGAVEFGFGAGGDLTGPVLIVGGHTYPVALIRGEAQMNPMFSPRRRRACEKPSSGGMVLGRKLEPLVAAYIDVRPELPLAWKGMSPRLRLSTTTAVPSLWQKVQFIPQASRILTRKVASVSMCVGKNEANGVEG